jgi:hypothetical protein
LAQVDSYGGLTVDLYDDLLKTPQPSQRELLWATLRKCEADLELFALATKNRKAKKTYESCVRSLKSVVGQVEPYLKR